MQRSLLFRFGPPEIAEEVLGMILNSNGPDAATLHNLAAVQLQQGKLAEAISSCTSSLALRPDAMQTLELRDEAIRQSTI